MKRIILISLGWAAAIIGVAIAGRSGVISSGSADALVIILPAIAIVTISAMSRTSCCGARA